jgi:endoglucanase
MMRLADAHGIGYLGRSWDAVAPGGWSCSGGPSLIKDYQGTPTAFGIGFRDHLRALPSPFKPL